MHPVAKRELVFGAHVRQCRSVCQVEQVVRCNVRNTAPSLSEIYVARAASCSSTVEMALEHIGDRAPECRDLGKAESDHKYHGTIRPYVIPL